MTASPSSPTSASSIPPALRAFLRDGLVSDGGGGSSTSASTTTTTTAVRESDVLLALQQVTKQVQAGELDEVREELLPLLATTNNSSSGRGAGGAAAFAPLWKSVFEIKAKEPSGFSQSEGVQIKVQIALFSSRLLRSLVAGHPSAQEVVFQALCSETLSLLRLGSSLAFASDPEIQPLVRTLVQLLCNTVTMHKELQKALFHKLRIVKPAHGSNANGNGAEAQQRVAVLQNLLASPDVGTVEAVQILLLNCIKSSATNSTALATSLAGRSLLGQLLHLFEATTEDEAGGRNGHSHDDDDGEDDDDDELEDFGVGDLDVNDGGGPSTPAKPTIKLNPPAPSSVTSSTTTQVTVGYAIFAHLFEIGLFRHMYRNLGPGPALFGDADADVVTTEQTLLLKTVDAWINAGGQTHSMRENSSMDQFGVLVDEFARLANWIRNAIAHADAGVDRRLLGVHVALVLVLENLIQLGMIGCEGLENDEQFRLESEEVLRRMRSREFVEGVVELLRAVSSFAPAISPFNSTMTQGQNGHNILPQGHAPTTTGLSSSNGSPNPRRPRLDHLSRALVQLLGVLVFQHSPSSLPQSFKERSALENAEEGDAVRFVQDLVRETGGLLLVLGMTQLDEQNPYIREHAVFTLRYLLQGNGKSQDLIREMRPVGV